MDPEAQGRIARLTRYPAPGDVNSLWSWPKFVPFYRVVLNFCVVYLCRYLPSVTLKLPLYRMIGVKVGDHVSFALGAILDVFCPHLVEVGRNSIIGYNSVVLAHEFLIDELRTGPVKIGQNVMIGANCTVLPGVVIGDGAVVSACSLVNSDVPEGAVYGGVPARPLSGANHGS